MPSGLHRRDSIGKADQGGDIYSAVRNPSAFGPSNPQNIKALKTTDRLETSAEKMHRQQMEAMKKGYIRIMKEDGSFIKLIAVTAKLMFMTAVFPPYMLFYVIPEFLFAKLLPKLFKEVFKIIERLPEWFSNTTTWLPSPNQILSLLVKPFAVAKQNMEDFLRMMMHYSQAARKTITESFQTGLDLAKIPFVRTFQVIKDITEGLQYLMKTVGNNAVKANDKLEIAIQALKDALAAMVNPIVQPIVQFIETKYKEATEWVKRGAEFIQKTAYTAVEKVKEKLMPPIEKTVATAKEFGEWVSNTAHIVAQPIMAWAAPKIAKANQFAKRVGKEIEKIRDKAHEAVSHVHHRITAVIIPFVDQTQNLINLMVTAPIVRLFKKGSSDAKSFKQKAQEFTSKVKGIVQNIRSAIQEKARKALNHFAKFILKVLRVIQEFLLTLPQKAWNALVKLGHFCVKLAKGTVQVSIKTFQLSILLMQFGMQLIRELKTEIVLYFRHARTEAGS